MSTQLGGMRLGMTVEEFIGTCQKAGGFVPKPDADDINLACSLVPQPLSVPGRPLIRLGGLISAKFCSDGARTCELAYLVEGAARERDDQVGALAGLLIEKYGPPQIIEGGPGDTPMRQCTLGQTAHYKRGWFFGPRQSPPHPVGWARFVFECDGRGGRLSHLLTLFYDDEQGIRFRSAEAEARGKNF